MFAISIVIINQSNNPVSAQVQSSNFTEGSVGFITRFPVNPLPLTLHLPVGNGCAFAI